MFPPPQQLAARWIAAGLILVTTFSFAQNKAGKDGKFEKPKFDPTVQKPKADPKMDKMEKGEPFDKGGDKNAAGKKGVQKFVEEVRTFRDPKPVAAAIDRWVEAGLASAQLRASPEADDAQFLRRVTLDIIGRIPTAEEASEFLASTDPQKRAKWVDELLVSPGYGDHFATIWRELMLPRDNGVKGGRDEFSPWLAEQFSRNRGWDRIVSEMLTAEGKLRETPQAGFIMANTDNGDPQAALLADSTGRLFWGVQLRCAECHDHPFASWKQEDFWGTAAFFSRLRKGYAEGKNPQGWTLTEAAPADDVNRTNSKVQAAPGVKGAAIVPPTAAGKASGKVVPAKYLGGRETGWTDEGPFRERFAQWAVSGQNPWFSANAVNRVWAHFFTRGLVTPVDGFNGDQKPSHPELLAMLQKELVDSGFDLKHLIRCVCLSRAYQRSSQPVPGSERDDKWISHRLVKVMRPEVLYDSVSIAMQPPGRKGGAKSMLERAQPIAGVARVEFVRFFGSRPDENEGSTVNQGIPQFLNLMNSPLLNATDLLNARLAKSGVNAGGTIDAAYLAAYSRKPTDEERKTVKQILGAAADEREGYAGLLWTLLNSAEFVTNH
jgi:hypothetical protein